MADFGHFLPALFNAGIVLPLALGEIPHLVEFLFHLLFFGLVKQDIRQAKRSEQYARVKEQVAPELFAVGVRFVVV